MTMPEEFARDEAMAMGAFREEALLLEDVLGDQEIQERIERGEDITGGSDNE